MNTKLYYQTAILAATALSLGAPQALAQDDSNEIVVTARRTEERLQDVPISITVFNQEQLSNRNVVNAADLATYTPSLAANTRFGSDATSFAIRGFSQELRTTASVGTYFADVVAPRGGGVITAGDGAGPGSFFDLQNVQVLKGPQGTLFGRNTTGGAVLLVPQRPTDEFGGYIEGSAGDFDMQRVQGVLNIPLGDQARLRLGFDEQSRDGNLNNYTGIGANTLGDVDYEAYRASFVVDLTPNLENYTIATYSHSLNTGFVQKLAGCNPESLAVGVFLCIPQQNAEAAAGHTDFYDVANTIPDPHSMINTWQFINTTTWDLSDQLTLKNIVSYAELQTDQNTAVFGLNWFNPLHPTLPFYFATSGQVPGYLTTNQATFVEEIQLQGHSFDDRLTWQAGLYYEESDPQELTGSRSVNRLSCDLSSLNGDPSAFLCSDPAHGLAVEGTVTDGLGGVNYINQAVYGQATYTLTDQLKLTGGIRYTWDSTVGEAQILAYKFNNTAAYSSPVDVICSDASLDIATGCLSHVSEKSEAPTWLVGLDYTPTENWLLYAKYARGYRQGSVNVAGVSSLENQSDHVVFTGLNRFDPEHVDTYEIGSKWSFHGSHPGVLNASLFYNDFTDQQVQLGIIPGTGAPTTAIINAGASTIWGLELESSIELFEGFDLRASYTYLNTNVDELTLPGIDVCNPTAIIPAANCVTQASSLQGQPLTYSPENKAEITASYRFPFPESVGDITAAVTYVYTDEQQAYSPVTLNPDGTLVQSTSGGPLISPFAIIPATELINININWDNVGGAPIDASIFATNVTDEEYYTFFGGLYVSGFETGAQGLPRMIGARLRYRFGAEAN